MSDDYKIKHHIKMISDIYNRKNKTVDAIERSDYKKGFCVGNIIKHVKRYEKTTTLKDLYRVIYYTIILIQQEYDDHEYSRVNSETDSENVE